MGDREIELIPFTRRELACAIRALVRVLDVDTDDESQELLDKLREWEVPA